MPWVNIFDNEDCHVAGGDQEEEFEGVTVEKGRSANLNVYSQFNEGGETVIYMFDLDGDTAQRGIWRGSDDGFGSDADVLLIRPSGGIRGRLFRVRVLRPWAQGEGGGSATHYMGLGLRDPSDAIIMDSDPFQYAYDIETASFPYAEFADSPFNEFPVAGDPILFPNEEYEWLMSRCSAFAPNYGGFWIWEVWVDDVPAGCDEIGRVSRVPVSAHNRTRVASVRLFPAEKRCLVANFNGAIAPGRTIVRADWQTEGVWSVSLSDGAIIGSGRQAKAMLSAHSCGETTVQATVTLDNGEVYNQLFVAEVYYQPFAPTALPVGSASLTVTA